ncbi:MAG: CHAT domain-containing protein [Acidobacteriota bacterium]
MTAVKVTTGLFLFLTVLLCFTPSEQPLKNSDIKKVMWQSAAEVTDEPRSVEDREKALKKLEESVRLLLNEGQTVEAARLLNRVGHLHLKLNNPQAAIKNHEKALRLLQQSPVLEVEVDNLNGIAEAYLHLRANDLAEEALAKSINLSERSQYTLGLAQALLTLSDRQNQDNHAVALETAQKALGLWESSGNKQGLARTRSQVGICYLAQNLLTEATLSFEQALELWRVLNNPPEQAEALIKLGYIEYRKGDWQSSISYYTQANAMLDENSEPLKMGRLASGLGAAFNENGLPENGVIQYQRALEYYQRTQDANAITYATSALGRTHYFLGDFPQALKYLQQSLKGVDLNSLTAALSLQYLGRVQIELDDYDAALGYLNSALDIYERSVNPKEAAQVRALIGQVYDRQGRTEGARRFFKDALETFTKLSDRVNQATVYYALGQLELKKGNLDVSEEYLRQSIDLTENIRRLSSSSDLTTAFSATVHERYQSYIECLMRKHQSQPNQGFAVRAFETSELARARSLTELLRATKTNFTPGLDPKLAEQERSLRQALRVKEDYKITLLGKAYKKEELDALEADVTRLETAYEQVSETIQKHYPAYQQITHPTGWTLREIQEKVIVDDETVLLEYSLGAERSYVWAITQNEITNYEIPAKAVITEAAHKVYELLTTAPGEATGNALARAAQELSEKVLSPMAPELNKRRIIVAADGALNYIPFQFLPVSSARAEPLVASYEVINVPSASILGQLRLETAHRRAPTKVLAAFGDPIFASNYNQRKGANARQQIAAHQVPKATWHHALRDIEPVGDTVDPSVIQPLFYSTLELSNLREVAGPDSLIATGFDATREKLAEADLAKYAILHIATHGILDPKRPQNSGLFLSMVNRDGQAQNGFLGLEDIYRLNAPVDLVVLSACRTGLGKDVRGEGLIGLTRGFMYAGASSVVASLWKVDDEATAELMKRFYTNMLQGHMPPSTALRAAQNSIREQPQWSAPYYWAAFTLQGEYQRVIKPKQRGAWQTYSKVLSVAALAGIVAIAFWWYFNRRARRATRAE